MIGPPDCDEFGECIQSAAWVSDLTLYPPDGQQVLHSGLAARVVESSRKDATVTIEYLKLYKLVADEWRQCLIDP